MAKGRRFWVIVHRWAGLSIALFLSLAGVTGSILVFDEEVETLLAPGLHIVEPPTPDSPMLSPKELREQVLDRYPGALINYMPFPWEPDRSIVLNVERVDSNTGAVVPWSSEWDELFIDPYTGNVLGHRKWGRISDGLENFIPFIYRLHYDMALGKYGLMALGIAALIWTLDCFVGFYLTLPVYSKRARMRGAPQQQPRIWLARWKPSWMIRWRASTPKFIFDLHRAGGLWLWPLLLVFAWSSVSFNLSAVYDPVMRVVGYERISEGLSGLAEPRYEPALDFSSAIEVGEILALNGAKEYGMTINPEGETGLFHIPSAGLYSYIFTSSADFRDEGGRSLVLFDSDSGNPVKLVLPQGQRSAFTLTEWITGLHMAAVWGLPWKIFVTLLGLLVTVLSVTGVLIWMKKRSARKQRFSV